MEKMKEQDSFHNAQTPRITLFSSVGGGPLQRLCAALQNRAVDARMSVAFSPEGWRHMFSHGAKGRLVARALSFGLYPVRAIGASLLRSAFGGKHSREQALLVVSTNPFFLPHLLVATRFLHRCKVIALMYDMYPDALEVTGSCHPLFSRMWTQANKILIHSANAVVYLGQAMRESAQSRYGAARRTAIIPTGASVEEFATKISALPEELLAWMGNRTVFSYVGNCGLMHEVDTLLDAIVSFNQKKNNAVFVFASTGPGTQVLQRELSGCENVRFIGPQKDEAWIDLLQRSHVSLVTLKDAAKHTSVPSKVYSALASGNVILAICPEDSDLGQVVCEEGCGIAVAPGEVEAGVEAMLSLSKVGVRKKFAPKVALAAKHNDVAELCEQWLSLIREVQADGGRSWSCLGYDLTKRGIDILASSLGLLVLSPVLVCTAAAIGIKMGRPLFFVQERPGLGGKAFKLRKFRTMQIDTRGEGAQSDGRRLTRLGKFLRASSLDELPTLWSVLVGDMSLVGPRPLLMQYLERYSSEQARRHLVKPGITGWAQVNGRNAISWEEKFAFDVWYVDHASLALDLRILFKTLGKVFGRKDIAHAGSATMPEFMGQDQV